MIDSIELSNKVEKQVCENKSRKYYRFRKTRFYGGCATADCLGCNLRCAYCWSQNKVWNPDKFGKYHESKKVAEKLLRMESNLVRISGGEPTICKDHLIDTIKNIPKNKLFILETNGILLDEDYISRLSNFKNIYVRVSLKGVNGESFEKITGTPSKYFNNQLNALKLLDKYNIENRGAIIIDFFTNKQIENLMIPNLEYESLIKYPFVMNGIKKRGLKIIRS
jgi:uncharacterized Fe-S cluster-containing radical SAM superfamily protein